MVVGVLGEGGGLMMGVVVGEEREFASKLMNDWLSPRATTMDKPHVRTSPLSPPPLSHPSLPQYHIPPYSSPHLSLPP